MAGVAQDGTYPYRKLRKYVTAVNGIPNPRK